MTYKEEFIKFVTECGVLTFGDFTLKSGRKAPYFVNTGNYKTGKLVKSLFSVQDLVLPGEEKPVPMQNY